MKSYKLKKSCNDISSWYQISNLTLWYSDEYRWLHIPSPLALYKCLFPGYVCVDLKICPNNKSIYYHIFFLITQSYLHSDCIGFAHQLLYFIFPHEEHNGLLRAVHKDNKNMLHILRIFFPSLWKGDTFEVLQKFQVKTV